MITDEEFRLFRNLIYEESGIYLKETRKDFLENRLAMRLKATGMSSPYWYYKFVTEKKRTELLILLDILTINETSFFRNKPQMDFFRDKILPDVIHKKGHDTPKKLRIWSAGCSTGEEPYSIAMIVLDAMSNAPSYPPLKLRGGRGSYDGGFEWDVKIFASDLSLTVLETANRGEYEKDKINATVDEHYISRYFEKNENRYRVKDEAKKMVVFDFHNLKNDNGISDLDIIFCRNVMIYFDLEEQKRLVNKFHQSLNPDGYLLIGHAESLQGMNTGFQFIYHNNGTAYKKYSNSSPISSCKDIPKFPSLEKRG